MRQMRQAEARHSENADGETNNEEANNEQMDQGSSSGSEGLPVRLRKRHLIQTYGWKSIMEVTMKWKMKIEISVDPL